MEGERGALGKLAKKELDWFERTILETTGQSLEKYLQGMTLFDRAYACLRAENHEEAIELFQQVLLIDPDHVQSYGNMALAHSSLGNQKIALQYLDKALLLDPTYEPAQQNRKNISRLKEGGKCNFETKEVFYYQEQLASLGEKRKKPRVLSWFSIF
jgi:tetratricopeptide (TPR) repeat protein